MVEHFPGIVGKVSQNKGKKERRRERGGEREMNGRLGMMFLVSNKQEEEVQGKTELSKYSKKQEGRRGWLQEPA